MLAGVNGKERREGGREREREGGREKERGGKREREKGREREREIKGLHLLLRGAFFISSLARCYGIVKFPPCTCTCTQNRYNHNLRLLQCLVL